MRWGSRVALALLGVGALAAGLAWAVGRVADRVERGSLERELSSALGREVRIGGGIRIGLFPRPALEASDVSVANLPGRASPFLVHIDEVRLALALLPLLRERVHCTGLRVDGAQIELEPSGGSDGDLLPVIDALEREPVAPERPFALRIDRFELRRATVVWRDPATEGGLTLAIDALRIDAEGDERPVEWSVRGSLRGGVFDLEGRGGTLASLLEPTGPWPLSLEGRLGAATLRVDGAIERPTRFEGLDLDVELEIPDVGTLLAGAPDGPALGRARVSGHLVDTDGKTGFDRIAVESDPDAELRVHAKGSVRELSRPSGIELDAEIDADRLRFLEPLVGRSLPDASLRAKLRLSDRDGALAVRGDAHAKSPDGSFSADLAGGLADARAIDALDAKLRVAAPDVAFLARLAGFEREVPDLGPVVGSARLRASAGVYGVEDLAVDAGRKGASRISIRGAVRDLRAFRGVALSGTAASQSFAALGRVLGLARPLPDVGPLELQAKLADARGALGIERFELHGGDPAALSVDVSGSLADLRQLDALAVEGRVRARAASELGALVGVELPAVGPVVLEGRARGSDERIESDGSATLGETRIDGSWTARIEGPPRPIVTARLHSAHLRLEDLGLGPQGGAPARGAEAGPVAWRDRELLPFDELRRVDAQLDLRADLVTAGSSVEIRDAGARVGLEDGDLRVSRLGLAYQGGRISGGLRVDARTPDPMLALRADAIGLDLERLGVALGRPGATGSGQLDLRADLSSRGRTPDALLERLDGHAAFAARDWSAASELARRFLFGLARAFVPGFRRTSERVGCLRGALAFANGEATVDDLVLVSDRATVVGKGTIDLVKEQWHLELVPEVHDPGLLEIASAVRVTGPLDAPHFAPVPLDLVAGSLRGLVRGALLPARAVTGGAQRALGPMGKLLAPLHSGLGLGAHAAPDAAAACALPPAATPTAPRG